MWKFYDLSPQNIANLVRPGTMDQEFVLHGTIHVTPPTIFPTSMQQFIKDCGYQQIHQKFEFVSSDNQIALNTRIQ